MEVECVILIVFFYSDFLFIFADLIHHPSCCSMGFHQVVAVLYVLFGLNSLFRETNPTKLSLFKPDKEHIKPDWQRYRREMIHTWHKIEFCSSSACRDFSRETSSWWWVVRWTQMMSNRDSAPTSLFFILLPFENQVKHFFIHIYSSAHIYLHIVMSSSFSTVIWYKILAKLLMHCGLKWFWQLLLLSLFRLGSKPDNRNSVGTRTNQALYFPLNYVQRSPHLNVFFIDLILLLHTSDDSAGTLCLHLL